MEQKIILITGTNSGFGWLTAKSCAALGHKIYGTMRATKGRNADKVKELVKQLVQIRLQVLTLLLCIVLGIHMIKVVSIT